MSNHVLQTIEFMKIVEQLCLVKRDNKMSDGRQETDADHILKLCYWVMLAIPRLKHPVDALKMQRLALVHDLVEAKSGDVSLSAQMGDPELKKIKKQKEHEAIVEIEKLLPAPLNEQVYELFEEYEARQTREARIVWCLDKLDANLQANLYNGGDVRYWADCPNGELYYRLALEYKTQIADLDEEFLTSLEREIVEISRANIRKCGIKTISAAK